MAGEEEASASFAGLDSLDPNTNHKKDEPGQALGKGAQFFGKINQFFPPFFSSYLKSVFLYLRGRR